MRVKKEDVEVRMEIPGAVIRRRLDFGDATGFGAMSGEYFSLAAGVDTAPLFQGLEGDMCQCPHWGFVLSGQLTTTDADGAAETVGANELFFMPAGHNVKVDADADFVMFSPQGRAQRGHRAHARQGERRLVARDTGTTTTVPTKQRLIDAGLPMLLQQGYNDLGVQTLLVATGVPKGSFYHHFRDKEDFALQVIDQYMHGVHAGLDECLGDTTRAPLARVRCFFDATLEHYRTEGYMGCLLGGLGQELSGVSDVFRQKVDECFSQISARIAACLEEARQQGDLPPESDARQMAALLVDCWEGAALRSRLRRDPAPLTAMLDFYFRSAGAAQV